MIINRFRTGFFFINKIITFLVIDVCDKPCKTILLHGHKICVKYSWGYSKRALDRDLVSFGKGAPALAVNSSLTVMETTLKGLDLGEP